MENNVLFKIEIDGSGNVGGSVHPALSTSELAGIFAAMCDAVVVEGRTLLNVILSAAVYALAESNKEDADRVWNTAREQCDALREQHRIEGTEGKEEAL